MIYTDHASFLAAIQAQCAANILDKDAHKFDCVFIIGDALKGHHLNVDRFGWHTSFQGIKTVDSSDLAIIPLDCVTPPFHNAAPLTNLQAALLYLTSHG